jgi:hypothetical protein
MALLKERSRFLSTQSTETGSKFPAELAGEARRDGVEPRVPEDSIDDRRWDDRAGAGLRGVVLEGAGLVTAAVAAAGAVAVLGWLAPETDDLTGVGLGLGVTLAFAVTEDVFRAGGTGTKVATGLSTLDPFL